MIVKPQLSEKAQLGVISYLLIVISVHFFHNFISLIW